ncbi:MAG: peptidase M13 [Gammaproteobacteria bacterium]|nr:peptidase M13 [Gammaproteobacteria bacterium]
MKKLIVLTLSVLAITGCGNGNEQTLKEEPAKDVVAEQSKLTSGLYLDYMDTSIKAGDDFNLYVNGGWIKTAKIPADRTTTSVGLEVHEAATANVRTIIEASAEGNYPQGSDEQKVGDLYSSYMDMEIRNKLGIKPIEAELVKIDAIANKEHLAIYFAESNKYGIDQPFALGQYVDFKDPNTYMMFTWQGGLGLPDREYYFEEGEKQVTIREAYINYIENMFELAGFQDAKAAAEMIMALETRIASVHMKKEKTRDMVALYNKVSLENLSSLMPDFSWDKYLETAGVDNIDGLVITQIDYTKALNEIIKETTLDDWKTYLYWKVLTANATYLTEAIDNEQFNFNSKVLRGVEQPLPLWKRAVTNVNNNLGEVVGKVYVSKHFPPEAKDQMLRLVDNLVKAYEKSIKSLDWMGEETRAQALDKLYKFTPKIGYPDKWRDYTDLKIDRQDLYGNIKRSAEFIYAQNLARQGGDVDRSEWQMTPQTVNAYYNPPLNEIVFPAAILQPPFFDMKAESAVNYGAIGAVIGHEIGHGFDDSGSTFDGDGVLRNWWTDNDREEFKARTGKLIAQYNEFKPYPDISVNGEFTLGENIGDLGGLSIALLAYEMSLAGEEGPVMDGYTARQRVFLGYAQSWRGKSREEAIRVQIKTDPHSPGEYRVNGVVRNIPDFYELFDVKEGEALHIPVEERVKIW